MPIKPHKKTFLLFEILIALSLMATLISILFSFMVQSMKVEKKMETARKAILERQNLQIRFQDLLTTLAPSVEAPPLYTQKFPAQEKESLIAVFDNGIDPDPLFSGMVMGRIYVDENHDLCLAYWPYQAEEVSRPWRKEVLLSNVSDFSLSFLRPNSTLGKIQAIWEPTWPKKIVKPLPSFA